MKRDCTRSKYKEVVGDEKDPDRAFEVKGLPKVVVAIAICYPTEIVESKEAVRGGNQISNCLSRYPYAAFTQCVKSKLTLTLTLIAQMLKTFGMNFA